MQEILALRYYTRHFSEFTTQFYVKKYAIEFEVYLRSGCQTVIVKNAFDHRQWNTTKCGKTNEVFRRKHEKRKTDQFATWLLLIDTWTEQLYLTLKSRIKWYDRCVIILILNIKFNIFHLKLYSCYVCFLLNSQSDKQPKRGICWPFLLLLRYTIILELPKSWFPTLRTFHRDHQ